MANWHYYNEKGEKIGPIRGRELKALVQQGIITQETKVEDAEGRIALAKQVTGLTFPDANPFATPTPAGQTSSLVGPPPTAQPVQVPHATPSPPPPVNLFCTNCGNSVSAQAVACMSCGAKPTGHKKFCRQCGVALNAEQVVCVKCGAKITGGFSMDGVLSAAKNAFQNNTATEVSTNQNQSLIPIILPGLMVFLFFTPHMAMFVQDLHSGSTHLIWGWQSWFGMITLLSGLLILGGKVIEHCLPSINKFPPQLYVGLYGISVFVILAGLLIACVGGYGIWGPRGELLSHFVQSSHRPSGSSVLIIPMTALIVLAVTVYGLLQPWLSRKFE